MLFVYVRLRMPPSLWDADGGVVSVPGVANIAGGVDDELGRSGVVGASGGGGGIGGDSVGVGGGGAAAAAAAAAAATT